MPVPALDGPDVGDDPTRARSLLAGCCQHVRTPVAIGRGRIGSGKAGDAWEGRISAGKFAKRAVYYVKTRVSLELTKGPRTLQKNYNRNKGVPKV